MNEEATQPAKRAHEMNVGERMVWTKKLARMFRVHKPPLGHTNQARNIRAVRYLVAPVRPRTLSGAITTLA